MSDATKEVKLKFTVEGDSRQASKAMEDLAKHTERVSDKANLAERDLQRLNRMLYSAPEVYDKKSGIFLPGGLTTNYEQARFQHEYKTKIEEYHARHKQVEGGGGTGKPKDRDYSVLEGVTKLGIALEMARGIAELGLAIMKLGESTAPARDKLLDLQRKVPIVGHTVAGITEVMLEFRDRIHQGDLVKRLAEREHFHSESLAEADSRRQYDLRAARLKAEVGQAETAARLAAHPANRRLPEQAIAGAFGGLMAGGTPAIPESVREAKVETTRAALQSDIAYSMMISENGSHIDMAERTWKARLGADKASREANNQLIRASKDVDEKKRLDERVADLIDAQAKLTDAASREADVLNRYRERALSLAEKDLALGRAKTAELKRQAEYFGQEEEKSRGAAQSFGMMSWERRQMMPGAVKMLKERGIESLPEEVKGILGGFEPAAAELRRHAEDSAQKDPRYQELQQLLNIKDARSLGASRLKLESEIKIKVQTDEIKNLEEIKRVLTEVDKSLKAIASAEKLAKDLQAQIQRIQGAATKGN